MPKLKPREMTAEESERLTGVRKVRCAKVINPLTRKPLAAAGATVELNTYWRRLLLKGDVVEVEAGAKKSSAKKEG